MEFHYLPVFVKKLKELSKKYPSIKTDFANLLELLRRYPHTGTSLGKDCYKIRLAIKSKNTGKSGGARVITCVKIQEDEIYFLTVYDKADQATVSDKDLKVLLEYINNDNKKD